MTVKTQSYEDFQAQLKAQGVSAREHAAVVCPICGTVQSIHSLLQAGAAPDKVVTQIGFSCEGRFSGAGPWPAAKDSTAAAKKRRKVRGCDWSLGGLLKLHNLEVMLEDKPIPVFEPASPEDAQKLEHEMTKD